MSHTHADIGRRLRQLRRANGLTGNQFGKLAGVSRGMVSQWESGLCLPPIDRLILLRQALPFSLDELLLGQDAYANLNTRLAGLGARIAMLDPARRDKLIDAMARIIDLAKNP